jgi:GAF domain-containing protein
MSSTSHDTIAVGDLARIARTIAEAQASEAIFASVADAAGRNIGYKLFTVMAFDAASMQVRRLYSSDPDAYSPGGAKAKRDTPWGRHVLEQGQAFIGYTAEDIRANFDDHQTIAALGLESVLNVPVRLCGRTLGTMNLLHDAGFYTASHLDCAWFLATQLIGALCVEEH